MIRGREITKIICSCGADGEGVYEVDTTDEEEKEYGCCHPGCCVVAYECRACHMRWTFALEAPEYRD